VLAGSFFPPPRLTNTRLSKGAWLEFRPTAQAVRSAAFLPHMKRPKPLGVSSSGLFISVVRAMT